jgi:hypothetical protein
MPAIDRAPEWLARVDHYQSERHRLSWRYTYDSRQTLPTSAAFPGFVQEAWFSHHHFLFADTYTFDPRYTNEFRFCYERPDANLNVTWLGSIAAARTLPQIQIANVSAPGPASANENFHRRYLPFSGDTNEDPRPSRVSLRSRVPEGAGYRAARRQRPGNSKLHRGGRIYGLREFPG